MSTQKIAIAIKIIVIACAKFEKAKELYRVFVFILKTRKRLYGTTRTRFIIHICNDKNQHSLH